MSTTYNAYITAADSDGNVQVINIGNSDNSIPIYYELETQDIEFSDRSHVKQIQDKILTYSEGADSSTVMIKQDDKDYIPLAINLKDAVSVSTAPRFKFNFLNLKWLGNSKNISPIFNGFYMEKVIDFGIDG